MRKLLTILSLLVCVGVSAQVPLVAPLVRNSPADNTYGTHYDSLGYYGFRTLHDTVARNATPQALLKNGMFIYTYEDSTMWRLDSMQSPVWVLYSKGNAIPLLFARNDSTTQTPMQFNFNGNGLTFNNQGNQIQNFNNGSAFVLGFSGNNNLIINGNNNNTIDISQGSNSNFTLSQGTGSTTTFGGPVVNIFPQYLKIGTDSAVVATDTTQSHLVIPLHDTATSAFIVTQDASNRTYRTPLTNVVGAYVPIADSNSLYITPHNAAITYYPLSSNPSGYYHAADTAYTLSTQATARRIADSAATAQTGDTSGLGQYYMKIKQADTTTAIKTLAPTTAYTANNQMYSALVITPSFTNAGGYTGVGSNAVQANGNVISTTELVAPTGIFSSKAQANNIIPYFNGYILAFGTLVGGSGYTPGTTTDTIKSAGGGQAIVQITVNGSGVVSAVNAGLPTGIGWNTGDTARCTALAGGTGFYILIASASSGVYINNFANSQTNLQILNNGVINAPHLSSAAAVSVLGWDANKNIVAATTLPNITVDSSILVTGVNGTVEVSSSALNVNQTNSTDTFKMVTQGNMSFQSAGSSGISFSGYDLNFTSGSGTANFQAQVVVPYYYGIGYANNIGNGVGQLDAINPPSGNTQQFLYFQNALDTVATWAKTRSLIAGAATNTFTNLVVNGTAGSGYVNLASQSSALATPSSGISLFADPSNRLSWINVNGYTRTFQFPYAGNVLARLPYLSSPILEDSVHAANTYIGLSSLSATTPLSYNNSTGAFTIQQANTSQSGYLSSTDWNTFNNKGGTSVLTLGRGITGGNFNTTAPITATLDTTQSYTWTGVLNTFTALSINGTVGNGFVALASQSSPPSTPSSGISLFANANNRLSWINASGYQREFQFPLASNMLARLPYVDSSILVDSNQAAGLYQPKGSYINNVNATATMQQNADIAIIGSARFGGTYNKPLFFVDSANKRLGVYGTGTQGSSFATVNFIDSTNNNILNIQNLQNTYATINFNDSGSNNQMYVGYFGRNAAANTNTGIIAVQNSTPLLLIAGGVEKARVTSAGMGIGNTSANGPISTLNLLETSSSAIRGFEYQQINNGTAPVRSTFVKYRGTPTTPLVINSGDSLGHFAFQGYDGSNPITAASISVISQGAVSTGAIGSQMNFSTASTSGVVSRGLTIDTNKNVRVYNNLNIGADSSVSSLFLANGTTWRHYNTSNTGTNAQYVSGAWTSSLYNIAAISSGTATTPALAITSNTAAGTSSGTGLYVDNSLTFSLSKLFCSTGSTSYTFNGGSIGNFGALTSSANVQTFIGETPTITQSGTGGYIVHRIAVHQISGGSGVAELLELDTSSTANGANPTKMFVFNSNGTSTYSGAANFGTTTAAAASVILGAVSTTQGFLPPVMTTTQMNAISSPATGLEVYNTTVDAPAYNVASLGGSAGFVYTQPMSSVVSAATTGTVTATLNNVAQLTVTPTGSITYNASGGVKGQRCGFVVTTSGTTSYTITFNTNFKSTGTITTGTVSGKVWTVDFQYDGTNWNQISSIIGPL